MRVLVTGADGFVGGWVVDALVGDGHEVMGTCHPAMAGPPGDRWGRRRPHVWVPLDLTAPGTVTALPLGDADAILHLAAVSSVREAGADGTRAWEVNLMGTVRLLRALEDSAPASRLVYVSSGEVYGALPPGGAERLRTESDPVKPCSVYAATKAAAEVAVLETHRRSGLAALIARPFPHTGPGQDPAFVVPAFARRLRAAREAGRTEVRVGNLDPVRDLLDVRDVARAYGALLTGGQPGSVYNVARGTGVSLEFLFAELARLTGVAARPVPDPALMRAVDITHLVGDAGALHRDTGWAPETPLTQTLRDVVDAQTD